MKKKKSQHYFANMIFPIGSLVLYDWIIRIKFRYWEQSHYCKPYSMAGKMQEAESEDLENLCQLPPEGEALWRQVDPGFLCDWLSGNVLEPGEPTQPIRGPLGACLSSLQGVGGKSWLALYCAIPWEAWGLVLQLHTLFLTDFWRQTLLFCFFVFFWGW